MKSKRKIYIVDDHDIIRFAVSQMIRQDDTLEICGEADSASSAFEEIPRVKPDVVLVDITLRESNGLELIKNLRACSPATRVLVLTMHPEELYGEMALRAGAAGYLNKANAAVKLLTAIQQVLDGRLYLSESLTHVVLRQHFQPTRSAAESPAKRLSRREQEVLHLIGQWKNSGQIASELSLSVKTVDYYREQLKKKLHLKTAPDLLRFAVHLESPQISSLRGDMATPAESTPTRSASRVS
jgi:DNA-binding NarL/FixJ family response regulator